MVFQKGNFTDSHKIIITLYTKIYISLTYDTCHMVLWHWWLSIRKNN